VGELEALIRQIVRDEVRLYLKELKLELSTDEEVQQISKPSSSQFDYDLFEKKYQDALKFDDEVHQKYQSQVQM